ncbi:MAG: hypothetical protein H3C39_03955 [Flavobacteriia bacterium]|nr:hypothetical protein [Flavobacteriia bacterium]
MKNHIFLGFIILFASCNLNTVYKNRESDLIDAEKIANELFKNIDSGDFEEAKRLFGSKFFKYSSEKDLNDLFDSIKTLGEIRNRKLIEWKTIVVEGKNTKSDYLLRYNSVFPNHQAEELISMEKENDRIKIYGFQVHSNSFE